MLPKHFKWLVVSVLAAAWITLQCGLSESSTNPVCTSITTAIRGLLLPIATPQTAPTNNTETVTTFLKNGLLHRPTFQNSYDRYAKQIPIIKYDTSTAANTETLKRATGRTITSVSLITRLTMFNSLRMTRDSTLTLAQHWKSTGLTGSQPWPSSTIVPLLIPPAIYFPKLLAKRRRIIICAATNTAKRTGSFLNIPACPLATKTLPAG